jgi:UDP-N-acetyl-D-glucosamine dehydrogenase
MGVAYKRNIEDVRESPALDLLLLLEQRGAHVSYSDPHVPSLRLDGRTLEAEPQAVAAAADCVVIVTDHAAFDYASLVRQAKLIVDTRNALKGFDSAKIVRL